MKHNNPTEASESVSFNKVKSDEQHQAAVAVVTDSVRFTYTSSVSDMVTEDFTPEGKDRLMCAGLKQHQGEENAAEIP